MEEKDAKGCNYQELERWVKEQFIHGIIGNNMLKEISSKLKVMMNTSKVISDQVLMWAK